MALIDFQPNFYNTPPPKTQAELDSSAEESQLNRDFTAEQSAADRAQQASLQAASLASARSNLQMQLSSNAEARREQLIESARTRLYDIRLNRASYQAIADPSKPIKPNVEATRLGAERGAEQFNRQTGVAAGSLAGSFARNRLTSEAATSVADQERGYEGALDTYEQQMIARRRGLGALNTLEVQASGDLSSAANAGRAAGGPAGATALNRPVNPLSVRSGYARTYTSY